MVSCTCNLSGVGCTFFGTKLATGFANTPYPELFDRIEIDLSKTGVSSSLFLDIIIPV